MITVRPILRHFVLWLIFTPLLFLEGRVMAEALDNFALQDPARTQKAWAVVTAMRPASMPEVQYQFVLPGDPTWYSASDMTGRRNLWVPITTATWRAALQRQQRIEVVYLPENPWANQPVGREGNVIADTIVGWGLFLVIDSIWIVETVIMFRNYLRCLAAAERRQLCTVRFWRTQHER